jgi:hypothetical protein
MSTTPHDPHKAAVPSSTPIAPDGKSALPTGPIDFPNPGSTPNPPPVAPTKDETP